ncbi:MAG: magnesium transporter CorA family protein [Candidatus Pacebacteria bacterium]|nr:magnesium transporter CorA family protein [Candidatus Paceibacterota bacterium]
MRQVFKNKITWVDITSPDEEDISYLRRNYKFHPLTLEELKCPSQRDKTESYDSYIFLVVHFPCWNETEQKSYPWELDIIITDDSLITVCYETNVEMRDELMEKVYSKDFEKLYLSDTIKLLYFILEYFFDFAMRQIAHIQEKINDVEKNIFSGKSEQAIPNISFVKRDILNFQRTFRYLKETLRSLSRQGPRVFGEEKRIYFEDLLGDSLKVENLITSFKDNIESLENTNNSLMDHKTNILTRIYTILSLITWPALLVIGAYQMNTRYLPFVGSANDFWLILFIAFIPSAIIFFYLRKKKLL